MLSVQRNLKKEGYLNNYKKEKQFESLVEKESRIPYGDCCPHESTTHAYWVRSQTYRNKRYLITWYRTDFIACECPWSTRANIFKHAIKINWLYLHSGNLESLINQDVVGNTFNDPPKISIGPQNLDVNVDTTLMDIDITDADAEAHHLANEKLFSKLELIKNNIPTSLSKKNQLIGLVDKLLEDANNLHIMDFDFTLGSNALDSSLKRKKKFLSPIKKQRRRKQNTGLDIDLNVNASEYEPFQFSI